MDTGRVFENIVFLELRRKAEKIYYFKGKNEVDFYYISGGKEHLLNVSYEMESHATREREIRGLVEAMKRFGFRHFLKRVAGIALLGLGFALQGFGNWLNIA